MCLSLVHTQSLQIGDCRKRQAVCFYNLIFVRGPLEVMSSPFQNLDGGGDGVQFGKIKVVCSSDGFLAASVAGDDSTTLFVSITPEG